MKHFLRITYNVFKFGWKNIILIGGTFTLIGYFLYILTKDKYWFFAESAAGITGSLCGNYSSEFDRFKRKGHY